MKKLTLVLSVLSVCAISAINAGCRNGSCRKATPKKQVTLASTFAAKVCKSGKCNKR